MAQRCIHCVALVVTCFKLLLIPTYKSTDFEVHRNWLAITYSKPIKQWYFEATSKWTLDYPPFFAYLEWVLSHVAQFVDPEMLVVQEDPYASHPTIVFQKTSAIVLDFVLIYAIKELCSKVLKHRWRTSENDILESPNLILAVLLIANIGFLIVDHIHFQYNGFLFGLLLLSIVRICQGKNVEGAFWFAVLLNFKHIFLYIAPAYFVYLLRCYCFQSGTDGRLKWKSFSLKKLFSLALTVLFVFALSFGPFIYLKQLKQVLSRLFPFKRGLCHAYWAPNFWALYNVLDKVVTFVGIQSGYFHLKVFKSATMTGGLVQEFEHAVLPAITPLVAVTLTLLSILPVLVKLWMKPCGPQSFLRTLVLCAFGSFMFGWHVHEKAILLIIIPLSLLALERKQDGQLFLILATVGHYSLFPLIFTPQETPIKVILLLMYTLYAFTAFGRKYKVEWTVLRLPLLSLPETLYLFGIIPLELFNSLLSDRFYTTRKLPFLPLMLTSAYCGVGVFYCWVKFYYGIFIEPQSLKKDKKKK